MLIRSYFLMMSLCQFTTHTTSDFLNCEYHIETPQSFTDLDDIYNHAGVSHSSSHHVDSSVLDIYCDTRSQITDCRSQGNTPGVSVDQHPHHVVVLNILVSMFQKNLHHKEFTILLNFTTLAVARATASSFRQQLVNSSSVSIIRNN